MSRPRAVLGITLSLFLLGLLATAQPRSSVELPDAGAMARRTVVLGPAGDLQQALQDARSGDVIVLEAGAVYEGPFVLAPHAGPDWITIMSSPDALQPLPAAGTRVTPEDAPAMARLVAPSGAVISTAPGAARYRFVGVEIHPGQRGRMPGQVERTRRVLTTLVLLSAGDNSVQDMPHHIVFERSYLHGDAALGTRRGIVMNGAHLALLDSHLADFKSTEDSQAVVGWEGTGPFLLRNNYLEAAGENVMFGGADPQVHGRVPQDIDILGNHFSKPLTWQRGHASHDGSDWTIKNLLELKNARRVLIEGNLFEHNWPQAQNGFAILFTVRNQDGASPWSLVEDVRFTNNILRRVASGINVLGHDDNYPSGRTQGLEIHNNLFYEIGGLWGEGHLLQLLNSPADIVLTDNTAVLGAAILKMEGPAVSGMQIRDNLFVENGPGIVGTGTAPGLQSIETYLAAPRVIDGNVLIGSSSVRYPPGLTRVADLVMASGTPPGVRLAPLCAALSRTERPSWC